MSIIDVIVSVTLLIGLGLFAFSALILSSNEDDLLEYIEFKDGDKDE